MFINFLKYDIIVKFYRHSRGGIIPRNGQFQRIFKTSGTETIYLPKALDLSIALQLAQYSIDKVSTF